MTDTKPACLKLLTTDLTAYHRHMEVGAKRNLGREQYLNRLMKAGLVLRATDREQLEELVAEVHLEVFGMTRQKKSPDRVNPEKGPVDWALF